MLWQTGTFSPQKEEGQLVSSPLGIYTTEEVQTEDGTELTPTTTPGSFIAQPAAGVTTVEAAEVIKGDQPIDAIRIKAAGIHSYNQEHKSELTRSQLIYWRRAMKWTLLLDLLSKNLKWKSKALAK